MSGPIYHQRDYDKVGGQVDETGYDVLLAEQTAREVHVGGRSPKIIDWHDNPRHQGLKFPPPPVVSESHDRPEQQGWYNHMEESQQAYRKRDGWVEHILGAPDPMRVEQQRGHEVNHKKRLKEKQSGG